jgi:hypothetical protein
MANELETLHKDVRRSLPVVISGSQHRFNRTLSLTKKGLAPGLQMPIAG